MNRTHSSELNIEEQEEKVWGSSHEYTEFQTFSQDEYKSKTTRKTIPKEVIQSFSNNNADAVSSGGVTEEYMNPYMKP